jgi:enoyl-CoA hydratase/carnithine racemase
MLVQLEMRGRIAVVTMSRPERLNAVNYTLRNDLMATMAKLDADPAVGAIVLTGAGRAFCAGQDLTEAASLSPEHISRLFNNQFGMYLALRELTKGCVAAINGDAVGEGFQLALCADLRISHAGARVGLPEVGVGMPCVLGGYLVSLNAGAGIARELAFSADLIGAQRAYDLGLLSALVPENEVLPRAIAAAEGMASRPAFALAMTKRRFRDATKRGFDEACDAALRSKLASFSTGQTQSEMRAFLDTHGRSRAG